MSRELTKEEIQHVISEGIIKYSGYDIPRRRQLIDQDIATAAVAKYKKSQELAEQTEQARKDGIAEWVKLHSEIFVRKDGIKHFQISVEDYQALQGGK